MVEKHGTWPANARVDVDYSNGKPKIKFTYPENGDSAKKQARKQNGNGLHTFILIIILVLVIYFPFFLNGYEIGINYPEECSVSLDEHYLNLSWYTESDGVNTTLNKYRTWVKGANFTCDNETYLVKFSDGDMQGYGQFNGFYNADIHTKESLIIILRFILLPIIIFFILNRLITNFLIKQKWYQKWLPKYQAEGFLKRKKKKYIKFLPEDIENNMVEIPLFKNVELDYKTDGDFSDKLERIKIREHQHNEYKKGKVGKKKVEIFKWYARFYFKTKPKNGYLEVIFQ